MKNFTIISDPGIDDLVALVLLYKLLPNAKNCLIPTFGNASENLTAKNAKEFISFVAQSWGFKDGSRKPLSGKFEFPWPDYFHGPDGVWNIHPNVRTSTIKKLKDYPSNKSVISLGPLTDTYKLFKEKGFKEITIMGGAFNEKGNETDFAEFNIYGDSDSACKFFEECKGVKVKIVPLDVTRKVAWSKKQIDAIPETTKTNIWLKKLIQTWFEKYNHKKEENFNLHDPLAVYLNFFPDQSEWTKSGVEVITKGKQRGRTIFQQCNPICNVAAKMMDAKKTADEIYSLVFEI